MTVKRVAGTLGLISLAYIAAFLLIYDPLAGQPQPNPNSVNRIGGQPVTVAAGGGQLAILGANSFTGNQNLASGTVLSWNGDTGISRAASGSFDFGAGTQGSVSALLNAKAYIGGFVSGGTKFTATGCGIVTTTGAGTAGTYTSATTGTCTAVITMNGAVGLPSFVGWACYASDRTTPADIQQNTASTTTTATISGTTVSGDVVSFGCIGY